MRPVGTAALGLSLPGHRAPAIGPEAPFEMLKACHERMQRSLQLLQKLQDHLARHGHDASAVQAAQDVLRYFNLAAPLHHQDEELHVFPPLLALDDVPVTADVQQLIQDHCAMEAAWQRAAVVLQQVADASASTWQPLNAEHMADLQSFASLYASHIALEESLVYPRARAVMHADALKAMSTDMVHRRVSRVPIDP